MQRNKYLSAFAALALAAATEAAADTACPDKSKSAAPDAYPTAELADYVFSCMVANGQTPEMLRKCSCSIDFIAAAIPFKEYEKIETLLRLQQVQGGGRVTVYKSSQWAKQAIAHFRDVQAESTLRCF